jgi:hypothetical protein
VAPRRRTGCAVVGAVLTLAGGGCGHWGADDTAASRRRGGGTVVIVPGGAQVTKLTFATGGAGSETDLGEAGRTASTAAFPLLAYRQFCGDVHLDEFGLAPPRMAVTVRKADGGMESLLVGSPNFTGGGTYAHEDGSSCVDLVTTSSVHTLARLAGEAAAAPFGPAPQARPRVEGERPGPDPADPWVEQVRRDQARRGSPTTGKGGTG